MADGDPDVFLDVSNLNVDEITLRVADLKARVGVSAEVLDLLKLNVGADVSLGEVDLGLKGVQAQALLRVRLDNVARIISDVLETLDHNPQLLDRLTRGALGAGSQPVDELGEGTGAAEPAQDVVRDEGKGISAALGDVDEDAGRTVDLGEGAGQAAEEGQTAAQVGESADRTPEQVGETEAQPGAEADENSDASAEPATPDADQATGGTRDETKATGRPDEADQSGEAAEAEAEQTEAEQAEAGQTEAGQAEAGQAEAGQAEAGQAEAGQAEAGQAETVVSDQPSQEVGGDDDQPEQTATGEEQVLTGTVLEDRQRSDGHQATPDKAVGEENASQVGDIADHDGPARPQPPQAERRPVNDDGSETAAAEVAKSNRVEGGDLPEDSKSDDRPEKAGEAGGDSRGGEEAEGAGQADDSAEQGQAEGPEDENQAGKVGQGEDGQGEDGQDKDGQDKDGQDKDGQDKDGQDEGHGSRPTRSDREAQSFGDVLLDLGRAVLGAGKHRLGRSP
ncbi:hypothetical protein [Herbidospora sp. RD11066]